MKKSNQKQGIFVAVLAVLMVGMSIGFAAYSQRLQITGTTTVTANKWSVHLVEPGATHALTGSATGTAPAVQEDTLSATYTSGLTKPGDKYTATVPVINDGTFDAKLTTITVTPLEVNEQKFLKQTIKYGEQGSEKEIYNSATGGSKISQPIVLTKNGGKANLIYEIEFVQPENYSDLPGEEFPAVSTTIQIDYAQSE